MQEVETDDGAVTAYLVVESEEYFGHNPGLRVEVECVTAVYHQQQETTT